MPSLYSVIDLADYDYPHMTSFVIDYSPVPSDFIAQLLLPCLLHLIAAHRDLHRHPADG